MNGNDGISHPHRDVYDVLIVDDDPVFRSAHCRSLGFSRFSSRDHIFHVWEAGDGVEALKVLDHHRVDCVLLDYRLPGEDGLSVLEQLLSKDPGLSVIMVTGAGDERVAVEAMKKGASDYLTKGGLVEELIERAILSAILQSRLLRKIEFQNKDLMHAERQRVMLESLGAACHHLGQPATVLSCCIRMLKNRVHTADETLLLDEAEDAVEKISDILWQLQHVCEFRTVPYIRDSTEIPGILALRDDKASPGMQARLVATEERDENHAAR